MVASINQSGQISASNLGVANAPKANNTKQQSAIKAQPQSADTFEQRTKPRWKGIIGFIAGALLGDYAGKKLFVSKLENKTLGKELAILIPLQLVLGFVGQILAERIGQKKS